VHHAVDHRDHRSAADDHLQCADLAGEVHRNPNPVRYFSHSLSSVRS
jgi:hypothetical protein